MSAVPLQTGDSGFKVRQPCFYFTDIVFDATDICSSGSKVFNEDVLDIFLGFSLLRLQVLRRTQLIQDSLKTLTL